MRHRNVSVDRLPELLHKSDPQWHVREVMSVLVEEDWGDGSVPKYRELSTVGDLLRSGASGLAMRFREVDPAIWSWLMEELDRA